MRLCRLSDAALIHFVMYLELIDGRNIVARLRLGVGLEDSYMEIGTEEFLAVNFYSRL